jgi:hypothetical protein
VTTVRAARVSPVGTVLDTPAIALAPKGQYQTSPCTIRLGGGTYTVFDQAFPDDVGIPVWLSGARLTAAGAPSDVDNPVLVSRTANSQDRPAIATDGTNHLVVFRDFRDVVSRGPEKPIIVASRVGPNGEVLDPNGIVIASARAPNHTGPFVDFDGTNYLVGWDDKAVHVSPAGTVIEATPITISAVGQALAFGGGVHLFAYVQSNEVWFTRVKADGTILDATGTRISNDVTGTPLPPTVAFDGASFIVAWERQDAGVGKAHLVRVNPTTGSITAPVTSSTTHATPGGVACLGAACVLAWGEQDALRWTRLSAGNELLDAPARSVALATANPVTVALGSDGQRVRADFLTLPSTDSRENPHVYDTILAEDAGPPVLVDQNYPYDSVAVGGAAGKPLSAYSRFEPSQPYASLRVHVRVP